MKQVMKLSAIRHKLLRFIREKINFGDCDFAIAVRSGDQMSADQIFKVLGVSIEKQADGSALIVFQVDE